MWTSPPPPPPFRPSFKNGHLRTITENIKGNDGYAMSTVQSCTKTCFFSLFFYVRSLGILGKTTSGIASPVMCPAVSLHFLFPSCMSTTPLTSQNQQTSLYRPERYLTEGSLISRLCLTSRQTPCPRKKYIN